MINFKAAIFGGFMVIGVALASFFFGRQYERMNVGATAKIDTVIRVDTIRIAIKQTHGRAISKPAELDTTRADSIFNAGLQQGIDSVRALYFQVMAPKHFATDVDSVGHIDVTYVPLSDSFSLHINPLPRVRETKLITVTEYVVQTDKTWRTVGLLAIAAIIVETAAIIIR